MKKILFLATAIFIILSALLFTGCPQQTDPRGGGPIVPEKEEPEDDYDPGILTGLSGTKWLWGASLLEFDEDSAVFRRNPDYPPYSYTVDMGNKTGVITILGNFTLSEDFKTLEIINYRNNTPNDRNKTYNAVFRIQNPEGEITIPDTVVGTEWNVGYDSGGSGERFLPCQWIIFFTKTESVNQSGSGVFVDAYTYDSETKTGWIYFINDFELLENGAKLYIPSYKQYGHDMTSARVY
ncbi:MAG: hypothetical protein LBQ88_07745 [Treponema sp.]|jgi:hypothetical protein|nr:hypothetical protein [Treponema sp.]